MLIALGNTNIGLIQTCLNIYNRSEECFIPDNIQPEWMLTFVFITGGVTCVTITILLLACSYWRYRIMRFARWSGFIASELQQCSVNILIYIYLYIITASEIVTS